MDLSRLLAVALVLTIAMPAGGALVDSDDTQPARALATTEIIDGSESPTGTFQDPNVTLELDFKDNSGKARSIRWYLDGSFVDNASIPITSSTVTLSDDVGVVADGDHDWSAEIIDDGSGNTVDSTSVSFTVDNYEPNVSNISPVGPQSSATGQVSFDLNDTDFGVGSDSLNVTLDVDGQELTNTTVTQNTTIQESLSSSAKTGGEHTINITVEDQYNDPVNVFRTYKIPDTFYIRDERDYGTLVPADGELRFFGEDAKYTRVASSGMIDMTGLPVGEEFIGEIEPTDGNYTERALYVDSIYEQQTAYVLNTTQVETVESRFVLDDPTAQYDAESVLKIRRAVNTSSGNTTFATIYSDRFGAEGVTAVLQNDTRYRLVVTNGEDSQLVGPYRAAVSETVEVRPGTPEIDLSAGPGPWVAGATLDRENADIKYQFADRNQSTDKLVVWVHTQGNPDDRFSGNRTYYGLGTVTGKASIGAVDNDTQYAVTFVVYRDNGDVERVTVPISPQKDISPSVDQLWLRVAGIGLLVLLAGAFSILNAAVGAIVVSLAGGLLWFIGFLPGTTSAAAVVISLFVSVIGYAYTRNR